MKKHLLYLVMVALGLSACGPTYVVQQAPPPAPAPPPPAPEEVSYQTFYDQLSPYGQWIEDPQYGYVWMPEVSADFKPYSTNGYWVYTDEGWAWNSNYPWGWAAFHYGRWSFRDGYGWMWIPGNEWAPAWVSWRNSDQYYGWAPLGPSVTMAVAVNGGYNPPPHYWCFVPHQYVASPQVSNYYVRETNNVTIINRTTIINTTVVNNTTINNTTVNGRPRGANGYGPDPNEVGRYTGSPLHPVAIRESRAPGGQSGNGSFAVYRPHVNAAPTGTTQSGNGNNGRPAFAPAHVQPLDNARPVNRTNYGNPQASAPNPAAGNTPPANTPPPNGASNRPTTFPGTPSGQMNNANSGRPERGSQPTLQGGQQSGAQHAGQNGQQSGGQLAAAGRQQQARSHTTQPNTNHPRPVANGSKPASQKQHPPHPTAKPENKPDNKP